MLKKSLIRKVVSVFAATGIAMSASLVAFADTSSSSYFKLNGVSQTASTGTSSQLSFYNNLGSSTGVSGIKVGVGCGMEGCYNTGTGCGSGCFDEYGYCTCFGTGYLNSADQEMVYSITDAGGTTVVSSTGASASHSISDTYNGVTVTISGINTDNPTIAYSGAANSATKFQITAKFHGFIQTDDYSGYQTGFQDYITNCINELGHSKWFYDTESVTVS